MKEQECGVARQAARYEVREKVWSRVIVSTLSLHPKMGTKSLALLLMRSLIPGDLQGIRGPRADASKGVRNVEGCGVNCILREGDCQPDDPA
jgi:hypothetical protein